MKIAIVAGHFMPEVGYQEVYLAKAFSRLGHTIRVFSSNRPSPSAKKLRLPDYPIGVHSDTTYKYQVHRLQSTLSIGALIICKGLEKAVHNFDPDVVIVLGVGKLFPFSIISDQQSRKYKLLALFGDNSDYRNWSSLLLTLRSIFSIVIRKIMKNWLYVKAVKYCDKLVLYTGETEEIVSSYLPRSLKEKFKRKVVMSTLGFDPDEFYFDANDRIQLRRHLNISEDQTVLITSTKVNRRKNLESMIDTVSKLRADNINIRYIIVGFLDDTYARKLKTYISKQPRPDIFYSYSFLPHQEIRKLYCASDIGLWQRAAISIQEAMGTGLPVILENKPSINHLIKNNFNGLYFQKNKLESGVREAINIFSPRDQETTIKLRKDIGEFNCEKLSYDKIALNIINNI